MAMGRPRRYETPDALQRAIDDYFDTEGKQYPTITGLCLHLDFTSRQALIAYEGYSPEFFDTIKRAKLRVENAIEKLLMDPKYPRPVAAIFNLKCNFGWRDNDLTTGDEPTAIGAPIINAPAEAVT